MSLTHKLLDPKNDVAFKRIFGSEDNKDILIHFLNDMLVFKNKALITDITYLPTIQDPDIASQKTSIVDVLCVDKDDNRYIVEMQVAKSSGFEKRAQYYAAKAYSSQAKVGSAYGHLKEVVFIAIADYVLFPDKKAIKSDHVILDRDTHEHDLKDFSFTFLELPKFKKGENDLQHLDDKIEKWCYFFKYAEDIDPGILQTILDQHTIMEKAMKALIRYNWREDDLLCYDEAEKRRNDYESSMIQKFEEGREEGREEGKLAEKFDIARNLMAMNLDEALILQSTGLSQEELDSLRK